MSLYTESICIFLKEGPRFPFLTGHPTFRGLCEVLLQSDLPRQNPETFEVNWPFFVIYIAKSHEDAVRCQTVHKKITLREGCILTSVNRVLFSDLLGILGK